MAIRHKRKNSAGYTWQTGDLVEGQIGLNIADGTLHFDKADGSTVTIAPITDTDTTYAISAETNAAGADLRLTGSDATTDNVTLAAGTGITITRTDADTITIDSTNVSETLRTLCYNADSVTLTKGMPVYVFGAQGQNISVKRAINTGDAGSAQTLGLVEANIAAGAEGYVVTFGEVNNMNTDGYTEGAAFYLGSTAGTITFTKPYAPAHMVYLGFVEKANASSGRLFVKVQNGYELDELHNVNIDHNVALNVNDYLRWNTAGTLWENSPLYISDDGAPQLGGNLDVNGNSIVSVSNGNITLSPDGTGDVILSADTVQIGDSGAAATLTTNGANDLILNTNNGTDSGTITIVDGANGNIELAPNGTGVVFLGTDKVLLGDSNTAVTVTTNGTGNLVLNTNNGTNSGSIQINQGAAGNIVITPDTTGDVYLQTDTVFVGDGNAEGMITTQGTGDLRLSTNNNTNSGYININNGANGHITLEPNGTGQVFAIANTVRIGDLNTTANITTYGTGNLTLSTNNGTNTGSITIAQGVNGQMTLACNGSGVVATLSPIITIGSFGDNNSAITGRHQATASASDQRHSVTAQKQRTDILLAAMTDEPAVYAFAVRDSAAVNRTFGRFIGRFAGTSTNPTFTLRGSADAFTTNNHYFTYETNKLLLGTGSNYTVTSGTGGSLTLTANNNTTSGTVTVASGTNADITVTPNGTGKTVITNAVAYEYVYTAGTTTGTITPNAALGTIQSITLTGSITWNAFGTPLAGQTITMIIKQPATGGPYTLTSTMLFAGASKTLSTAANAVDILSVTYDGTNYWASLSKGYA